MCARSLDTLLFKRTRVESVNKSPLARLPLITVLCSKPCGSLGTHDQRKTPSNLTRCPAEMLTD
jgi:hypothetical protein